MEIIRPSIPKGTRDFLPEQMLRRQFVMNTIRTVFEKYGYEPLGTPSFEKLDILSGKCGEEGEQLIFKLLKRGTGIEKVGRDIKEFTISKFSDLVDEALRYDLTVPLCRVIAMYQNEITIPFKRYQMQPVWRGDRPQKGRYREFYQCDADTVGSGSVAADAEICAMLSYALEEVGIPRGDYVVRVNNRKVLNGVMEVAGILDPSDPDKFAHERGIVMRAIDKIDRLGEAGVRALIGEGRMDDSGDYTKGAGLSAAQADVVIGFMAAKRATGVETVARLSELAGASATGTEGVQELETIAELLDAQGYNPDRIVIDPSVVRGLG